MDVKRVVVVAAVVAAAVAVVIVELAATMVLKDMEEYGAIERHITARLWRRLDGVVVDVKTRIRDVVNRAK